MKEPAEIFNLDNAEFHYVGRKIIRDTEVDVWAGERERKRKRKGKSDRQTNRHGRTGEFGSGAYKSKNSPTAT